MRLSTGSRAWAIALGTLALACLVVGFAAVSIAIAENGGCEVGTFTPDGTSWEPCSALNPTLVWGAALVFLGVLATAMTAATAAILLAITRSNERH